MMNDVRVRIMASNAREAAKRANVVSYDLTAILDKFVPVAPKAFELNGDIVFKCPECPSSVGYFNRDDNAFDEQFCFCPMCAKAIDWEEYDFDEE